MRYCFLFLATALLSITSIAQGATTKVKLQQEILNFWFGNDVEQPQAKWWNKDSAVDEEVKQRFSKPLQKAAKGHYTHWMETPEGTLALILLLDQFPRHIYRNQAKAFAYDASAQKVCLEGIRRGFDHQLSGYQHSFMLLPLEHSKELHLQEFCVLLFDLLRNQDPRFESNYDYAVQHRDIIKRFGRFPHRNATLGRPSTAEEIAFLKEPGSSF